ncbi:DNA polymerase [Planktothrix agardhii]|uniref:group II intron reverse transcriptase/maturase n=1 Tax=Planktothrix agardhii TaxID=1160 RepID=UPI001B8E5499|nr:group II intron reverse transcriptase/maturase [Planktothrix agardhii]CAH2571966.1 putative reverse transcriptase [Planktothrix rubescens]CAD0232545.1 DNA polymerase [Planktothrix agardhii]CAH2572416.1 putative reverse transcriptase [Planktothrix rubescens]CAH2572672.1 putative reverse transcriptase [Planktothrix rubescens]CAH2572743.1 putative reverse transcriptase [Planktothrix rubescens]
MKTSLKTTEAWNTINWAKVQRKVFKLQKRIYQASLSGQNAKARKLQKLLVKSYYAKLLAVRRVTQDNQGKKTAGVDGVKSITPKQRLELVGNLNKYQKAKPLRRKWIPKPNGEERPLGIPTIDDRVRQALVKSALEPQWEARFESESYGFRPGRSSHDAMSRIFHNIKQGEYYILDADISKCFDQINHDYLLSKTDCPSTMKAQIKQWLKAGVMDNGTFEATEAGTPQGGVISPLLANIALDGMIKRVEKCFPKGTNNNKNYAKIIRYADDFVVISPQLEVIQQCQIVIEEWLKPIGLELKPAKTRICHTLREIEVNGEKIKPGFDFLGWNFRQYPVGKHHSSKTGHKKILGFTTLIKPSKKAIKAHADKVKEVIKTHKTAPQYALIKRLNPIIRGWCNYHSKVVSKETFSSMDYINWQRLRAWTVSRCGKANYGKLKNYFRKNGNKAWSFETKDGYKLLTHAETPITRHVTVRPEASPYDGNWTYWSTRKGTSFDVPKRVATLLKKQKGKCNFCGQYFTPEDIAEIDHIIPMSLGGKDEYKNLQLLHRHCHDIKSSTDGSYNSKEDGCSDDNSQLD